MRGDEKPRCASGVQDSECRVWPRQGPREGSVSKGRSPGVNAPVSDQTAWRFSATGDLKSSLYVGQSWTK